MLKHARRAMIALTTSAVLTTGLGATTAEAVTPRSITSESVVATEWLAGQLEGGLLYQEIDGNRYAQYGPSLDVLLTFEELETQAEARQSILDAVEANIDSYVGFGDESYAGPTAKLLTALQTAGVDPATYGDGDLLASLRALVGTKREGKFGRAMDDSQWGDYSNTIGQAWAVRAFAGADHRFVGRTTKYLLKQQCEAGFFRESMKGRSCDAVRSDDERAPSVDATALAVEALRAAKRAGVAGLRDDIRQALKWLVNHQNRNGSFTGNGVANANSTGLAAAALTGTKWAETATHAATWLKKLQVTAANSAGTALEGETGAIAYNRASFRNAKTDGITGATAIEWALATAQSAVVLAS